MAPRGNIPGSHEPQSPAFRGSPSPIILWDMTSRDDRGGIEHNDRIDKLGHRASSRGAAVGAYGEATGRMHLIDGLQETGYPDPLSSILPFEPDNWTPRYHQYKKGEPMGRDSVWAIRLIADQLPDFVVANRSTMVIDNGDDSTTQAWGFLSDIAWITGRRTPVDSPGLAYSDSGFLAMLSNYQVNSELKDPGDRGGMPPLIGHDWRCTLALNISSTGGFVTDGHKISQLFHIMCWLGQASTTTGFYRAEEEDELGLRADVGFKFGNNTVARMKEDKGDASEDKDGDIKRVHLFDFYEEAETNDKGLDLGGNPNSGNGTINRTVKKKALGGWVKVKKYGGCDCCHYDYSYHHPPPDGSSGGGSSSMSGVPTVDPRYGGNGSGTPPTTGTDPNGSDPGVPTYDPGWEPPVVPPDAAPTAELNAPTEQAQHGYAPPASPGFTQRFNVFPKISANVVGTMVKTKPVGKRHIRVKLKFRISDPMAEGEVIELNVKLIPQEDNAAPINVYTQSIDLYSGVDPDVWYEASLLFKGFDVNDEQIVNFIFERRNDTAKGVNAEAELWIERSMAIMEEK